MRPITMDFMQSWWDVVEFEGYPMIDSDKTHYGQREFTDEDGQLWDVDEGMYDNALPKMKMGPIRAVRNDGVTFTTWRQPNHILHGIEIQLSEKVYTVRLFYKFTSLATLTFYEDFRETHRQDPANYFKNLSPLDFKCPESVNPCPNIEAKQWKQD